MDPKNFSLRKEPDPLLTKKLEDFDFNTDYDLKEIESTMIEIMKENNGIGISANQVGFDQRVIVVWPRAHSELKEPLALFNPKIVALSPELTEDEEGCLSFPDLFFKVSRPKDLVVEFVDSDRKNRIITLYGYDAKCVQHEIDHLDGVCFTSKISKLKLDMARKKQRKLQNGRTK
jgi:peptide deformylase